MCFGVYMLKWRKDNWRKFSRDIQPSTIVLTRRLPTVRADGRLAGAASNGFSQECKGIKDCYDKGRYGQRDWALSMFPKNNIL